MYKIGRSWNIFKAPGQKLLHFSDSLYLTSYFKAGSASHEVLKSNVVDSNLLKNLPHLTHFKYTGNLEVCHALLNKYCPKQLHFSYDGMVTRHQLAILDTNMYPEADDIEGWTD